MSQNELSSAQKKALKILSFVKIDEKKARKLSKLKFLIFIFFLLVMVISSIWLYIPLLLWNIMFLLFFVFFMSLSTF